MQVVKEFSVSLVNKPGVLAGVMKALGRAKVNVVAMTLSDSARHGVLRLVVAQTATAAKVLGGLGVPVKQSDVLQIKLANKAGAMAEVAGKLAAAHVNIAYAYCTSGASGGRTTGIINVENLPKAMKVLGAEKTHKDGAVVRRSQGSRRS
ncbi:MAG: hypothetical protein GWP14_03005 [Actinobacteria bacterium]|nr:hypothetical protein [Actinomycetota bacterium]